MEQDPITILIIDDDMMVRNMLQDYLQQMGYGAMIAENGKRGLEIIQQSAPDVVLLDLCMPSMDGIEVLERLNHYLEDHPVIVISALDDFNMATKALRLGAWDYLLKPFRDFSVLNHTLHQVLEKAELIRQNKLYQKNLEELNAKLQESLKKLQIEEESGRKIQMKLLPQKEKDIHSYHFKHVFYPSLYLSGDFLDYFRIDEHHIGFYVADVSGHGVSSALITMMLKSSFSSMVKHYQMDGEETILMPHRVLERINMELQSENLGKYLELFYGVIRPNSNILFYANGGFYPYPYLITWNAHLELNIKSPPVGLFPDSQFLSQEMELPESFLLFITSDGVFETLPEVPLKQKEFFLLEVAQKLYERKLNLDELINPEIYEQLPDDITFLTIQKGGSV